MTYSHVATVLAIFRRSTPMLSQDPTLSREPHRAFLVTIRMLLGTERLLPGKPIPLPGEAAFPQEPLDLA
ncbi:hypothetical protein N7501_008102 [Penicillium viridicatum]|nr:hypothetical protein N7501_008102 [Penicillium viridicatum]